MYVLPFTGIGLSMAVYLLFGIAMVATGVTVVITNKVKQKSVATNGSDDRKGV